MRFNALLAAAALAAAGMAHASTHVSAKDDFAQGEVRKVDKAGGKVTIKHGALPSVDMPPMTMAFRVKDPAMLDKVKQGDAIRFRVQKIDGNYTVTEIKPAS